jgi:Prenyltransferase and squalene oxidase repeat
MDPCCRVLWLLPGNPMICCRWLLTGRPPLRALPWPADRFSYCALLCTSILGTRDQLDVPKAVQYLASCRNFDGGFGGAPGKG